MATICFAKKTLKVVGGVIHNANEACVSPCESLQNLQPLPQVLILQLFLEKFLFKTIINQSRTLKFILEKCCIFKNIIGIRNLPAHVLGIVFLLATFKWSFVGRWFNKTYLV